MLAADPRVGGGRSWGNYSSSFFAAEPNFGIPPLRPWASGIRPSSIAPLPPTFTSMVRGHSDSLILLATVCYTVPT